MRKSQHGPPPPRSVPPESDHPHRVAEIKKLCTLPSTFVLQPGLRRLCAEAGRLALHRACSAQRFRLLRRSLDFDAKCWGPRSPVVQKNASGWHPVTTGIHPWGWRRPLVSVGASALHPRHFFLPRVKSCEPRGPVCSGTPRIGGLPQSPSPRSRVAARPPVPSVAL